MALSSIEYLALPTLDQPALEHVFPASWPEIIGRRHPDFGNPARHSRLEPRVLSFSALHDVYLADTTPMLLSSSLNRRPLDDPTEIIIPQSSLTHLGVDMSPINDPHAVAGLELAIEVHVQTENAPDRIVQIVPLQIDVKKGPAPTEVWIIVSPISPRNYVERSIFKPGTWPRPPMRMAAHINLNSAHERTVPHDEPELRHHLTRLGTQMNSVAPRQSKARELSVQLEN
ncbi:hypothetical protein C8R45DRAFT_941481 [Mycena sanguinolenta]|nr:hypothetical protein C8R45DRAFT_941481 [Mycena sanguinolenta]